MKKLATLLLAAGLVFGAATGASAIEFKAKGQFVMDFGVSGGLRGASEIAGNDVYGRGSDGGDTFEARQRVRLQLHAIASESLSGTVYFEIGETSWGSNSSADGGGALGADGKIVELKQAYIDWIVPNTELKVRMGIQGLSLPSYTAGSQVFHNDVAGIVLSNKFSDNVSLTAFWIRPYNDNYEGGAHYNPYSEGVGVSGNYLDNVDAFGLVLPLSFNGFKVTPWAMYTAIGQNFARSGGVSSSLTTQALPVNVGGAWSGLTSNTVIANDLFAYGSMWNAGVTGEITAANPFRIAFDFNYGAADYGIDYLSRSGWYGSLLFEYKMDWGTPGLYAWYSSGDDDDVKNGSERMAANSVGNSTNQFSNVAFNGHSNLGMGEDVIGTSMLGTWGLGVRLKDFSFLEDLKHTFRVNYINGTNSTSMASYLNGSKSYNPSTGAVTHGAIDTYAAYATPVNWYMTTEDYAVEIGLTSVYKVYDNFNIHLDAGYLFLHMDKEVWGERFAATDAWNLNASFIYSF